MTSLPTQADVVIIGGGMVGVTLALGVPLALQPYLPIAVVAALDAVFGAFRSVLDGLFNDRIFVISFLSYGDDHVRANPLNIVFLVIGGVVGAQLSFALLGLLLGQELGSITQVIFVCLGTAFWSGVFTPLLLPIISRLHALVFGTASRI